nr:hypothetical protein [Coleofasciculus sp. FACHB-129]
MLFLGTSGKTMVAGGHTSQRSSVPVNLGYAICLYRYLSLR